MIGVGQATINAMYGFVSLISLYSALPPGLPFICTAAGSRQAGRRTRTPPAA
jgi:hypothetical protein